MFKSSRGRHASTETPVVKESICLRQHVPGSRRQPYHTGPHGEAPASRRQRGPEEGYTRVWIVIFTGRNGWCREAGLAGLNRFSRLLRVEAVRCLDPGLMRRAAQRVEAGPWRRLGCALWIGWFVCKRCDLRHVVCCLRESARPERDSPCGQQGPAVKAPNTETRRCAYHMQLVRDHVVRGPLDF